MFNHSFLRDHLSDPKKQHNKFASYRNLHASQNLLNSQKKMFKQFIPDSGQMFAHKIPLQLIHYLEKSYEYVNIGHYKSAC